MPCIIERLLLELAMFIQIFLVEWPDVGKKYTPEQNENPSIGVWHYKGINIREIVGQNVAV
jgi:hypothetical protein